MATWNAQVAIIRTYRERTPSPKIFWCGTAQMVRCAWRARPESHLQWTEQSPERWTGSIHAVATNQVASTRACGLLPDRRCERVSSCHMEHNASGPARLLRPATPAAPGVDVSTQDCITCHNAEGNISARSAECVRGVRQERPSLAARRYK